MKQAYRSVATTWPYARRRRRLPDMATFVVRVWLPDRPGALGAIASRIGAVRGEIVGIEILERGGGRAVDDLVVELPDGSSLDLLVAELAQVDGVDVEVVRPVVRALHGSQRYR